MQIFLLTFGAKFLQLLNKLYELDMSTCRECCQINCRSWVFLLNNRLTTGQRDTCVFIDVFICPSLSLKSCAESSLFHTFSVVSWKSLYNCTTWSTVLTSFGNDPTITNGRVWAKGKGYYSAVQCEHDNTYAPRYKNVFICDAYYRHTLYTQFEHHNPIPCKIFNESVHRFTTES